MFLISVLILFLELASIRWFPAHVLYLTFFTNVVLLACFLGMSVGCLAANHRRRYLTWTPLLLLVALAAAHAVEISSGSFVKFVDVGNQASPENIYFGTEYHSQDLSRYAIPVEVLCGFFFLVIALALIGPGQELGRALNRWPNRVQAYTLNIAGSIAGILLFAASSWLHLSPSLVVSVGRPGTELLLFRLTASALPKTRRPGPDNSGAADSHGRFGGIHAGSQRLSGPERSAAISGHPITGLISSSRTYRSQ